MLIFMSRRNYWNRRRVRSLRDLLDETQEQFAVRFRVTIDAVRTWEQGKGYPSGPVTLLLDQLEAATRESVPA